MLIDKSAEDRLAQLQELRDVLAEAIDKKPGARDLAGLSRQYRDTIKEIEELENMKYDDEIMEILKEVNYG